MPILPQPDRRCNDRRLPDCPTPRTDFRPPSSPPGKRRSHPDSALNVDRQCPDWYTRRKSGGSRSIAAEVGWPRQTLPGNNMLHPGCCNHGSCPAPPPRHGKTCRSPSPLVAAASRNLPYPCTPRHIAAGAESHAGRFFRPRPACSTVFRRTPAQCTLGHWWGLAAPLFETRQPPIRVAPFHSPPNPRKYVPRPRHCPIQLPSRTLPSPAPPPAYLSWNSISTSKPSPVPPARHHNSRRVSAPRLERQSRYWRSP